MIAEGLMFVLGVVATVVSVPLSLVPLPAFFSDGTVSYMFAQGKGLIDESPARVFVDLEFGVMAVEAWWGVKLALLPIRWLMATGRRWLGPLIPSARVDAQGWYLGNAGTSLGRAEDRRQAARSPSLVPDSPKVTDL